MITITIVNRSGVSYDVQCDECDADLIRRSYVQDRGHHRCCRIFFEGKVRHTHRVIMDRMGLDWDIVDHIDGNALNNCRANLRQADKSLNCRNRLARGTFRHNSGTWIAQVGVSTARFALGSEADMKEKDRLQSMFPGKRFSVTKNKDGTFRYQVKVFGPHRASEEEAYQDYLKLKHVYHGGIVGRRL